MGELLLHVGHSKTGSSFLQSALALSRERLEAAGVDYHHHYSLGPAAKGRITAGNGPLLAKAMVRGKAMSLFERCDRALFSSELLFLAMGGWTEEILENFRRANGIDSVRILLFIRNPIAHCSSLYQQLIKRLWLDRGIAGFFGDYDQPELVRNFCERFGDRDGVSLSVRNYSRCANIEGELTDFLSVGAETLVLPDAAGMSVNRSLSRAELALQRALNRHLGKRATLVADRLCEKLPVLESHRIVPPVSVQRDMIERLEPMMQAVNQRVERDHRYQSDFIKLDGEEAPRLTAEQLDVIAAAIAEIAGGEAEKA